MRYGNYFSYFEYPMLENATSSRGTGNSGKGEDEERPVDSISLSNSTEELDPEDGKEEGKK